MRKKLLLVFLNDVFKTCTLYRKIFWKKYFKILLNQWNVFFQKYRYSVIIQEIQVFPFCTGEELQGLAMGLKEDIVIRVEMYDCLKNSLKMVE